MLFDKDSLWDWEKQDVMHISVPMSFEENPRITEEEYEVTTSSIPKSQVEYGSSSTEIILYSNGAGSHSTTPTSTPVKLRGIIEIYARCSMSIIELESYEEASRDKAWQQAMETEMEMIEKNETWELVERPMEKPVIRVKLVYKTKLNLYGSIQKHQVRLVVKGYAQKPVIDFNETFSPMARLDTIRTLIALAAQKG